MAKFKVGDIVVGQNFVRDTYRNKQEGEIVIAGERRLLVYWSDNTQSWVVPEKLKYPDDPITPKAIEVYNNLINRITTKEKA